MNINKVAVTQQSVAMAKDILTPLLNGYGVPTEVSDRVYSVVELAVETALAKIHLQLLTQHMAALDGRDMG